MPTICVIGGTGFLGTHLLKLMQADSQFRVRVLSRKPTATVPHLDHCQIILGDLLDAESLHHFLEPDAIVINLAYMPTQTPQDNLLAARNLAYACVRSGIARLIHVSTAVVVGRTSEKVVTEKTPCLPFTEYEKTRLKIEQALLDQLRDDTVVTILRPTEVFGDGGEGLMCHVADLLRANSLTIRLKMCLYGKRRLHLVCVQNVISAIAYLALTEQDVHRQCFILSDDNAPENNYLGVINLLGEYLTANPLPAAPFTCPPYILSMLLRLARRGDIDPCRTYSSDKLLRLGFRKPVDFVDGLRGFTGWLRRTGMGGVLL